MVIAGLMLGVVAFNAMPGTQQKLQTEAQRVALLLQMAREEAIVRNRPIAFEANDSGYRFLERDATRWIPIAEDALLRERIYDVQPLSLFMSPAIHNAAPNRSDASVRIVFGREPVDRPFVLTFSSGDNRVAVRADGIGNFTVE